MLGTEQVAQALIEYLFSRVVCKILLSNQLVLY